MKKALLLLIVLSQSLLAEELSARDLGTFGELFPIAEESLLEVIKNKIKSLAENGELEKHQQNIFEFMVKGIEKPLAVQGLTKTKELKSFLYDPSITVPYDLKDDKGSIFYKAGTTVNPLDSFALKYPLLFIDGDDNEQIAWAVRHKPPNPKIILVSGKPFDLMKKYDIPIYFDQSGSLIKKFGITQVPARIIQEGRVLKVEEVFPQEGTQ